MYTFAAFFITHAYGTLRGGDCENERMICLVSPLGIAAIGRELAGLVVLSRESHYRRFDNLDSD